MTTISPLGLLQPALITHTLYHKKRRIDPTALEGKMILLSKFPQITLEDKQCYLFEEHHRYENENDGSMRLVKVEQGQDEDEQELFYCTKMKKEDQTSKDKLSLTEINTLLTSRTITHVQNLCDDYISPDVRRLILLTHAYEPTNIWSTLPLDTIHYIFSFIPDQGNTLLFEFNESIIFGIRSTKKNCMDIQVTHVPIEMRPNKRELIKVLVINSIIITFYAAIIYSFIVLILSLIPHVQI